MSNYNYHLIAHGEFACKSPAGKLCVVYGDDTFHYISNQTVWNFEG